HMRLDSLDEFIAGIDIDSGITIGSHWGRILAMDERIGQHQRWTSGHSPLRTRCSKRSSSKAARSRRE
ncbi:MAG TPA: hypothetical protein PLZ20_08790, partial [Nitrospira sp.]|nr:hypothetical protein [Nitrospira sp.]